MTERELRTLTAVNGPWVAVRRGVYAERELWDAGSSREQMRLRDLAAHLTMVRTHVLSHDSSARAHGIPLLRPRRELVHVTRPGVQGARTEHGVKHHLYRTFNHVHYVADMPVHDMARTAVDIAREHGVEPGLVAIDHVLSRGVPFTLLDHTIGEMHHWPYISRAREALAVADPGAESPGESLLRLLVIRMGYGIPEPQFPIRLNDRVVWSDLRLGRHLFEFDGRTKYRGRERGGVADGLVEDVLWAEKLRERDVCAQGFGMSRVVWDELWGHRRADLLVRLEAEYLESVRRFGTQLPEQLEAFAARMRGRRRAG